MKDNTSGKSKFINQIMRGRLGVREIEDIGDNTLNFAQAKAIISGNPLVLEKAVADQELARLSRLVAVAHTKCREQSGADAATADLPLIQVAAARMVETTADAFEASMTAGPSATADTPPKRCGHGPANTATATYESLRIRRARDHRPSWWPRTPREACAARDLDHATVEVRVEGVPRATTQITRRSLSADIGTIRQLENRIASLPRLAADVEARRQEALSRIEQAENALAEPFKHADALKAAQANSARIDQLMADAAKPEEPAQEEDPTEIDPRLEKMQRLMNASFPQESTRIAPAGTATATHHRTAEQRRQQDSQHGR